MGGQFRSQYRNTPFMHTNTHTGVAKALGGMMEAGVTKVTLQADEVGPLDATTIAFERGDYTFYCEDGSVFDEGK